MARAPPGGEADPTDPLTRGLNDTFTVGDRDVLSTSICLAGLVLSAPAQNESLKPTVHELATPAGTRFAIVGENRAGKSNLVHALRLVLDASLPNSDRQLRAEDSWDGLAEGEPDWDPMADGEVQ